MTLASALLHCFVGLAVFIVFDAIVRAPNNSGRLMIPITLLPLILISRQGAVVYI